MATEYNSEQFLLRLCFNLSVCSSGKKEVKSSTSIIQDTHPGGLQINFLLHYAKLGRGTRSHSLRGKK